MSDERFKRLEDAIRRVSKEIVLQGERLRNLEEGSRKLEKLDELDRRVTAFAGDIEAARRDRAMGDMDFKERREVLQNHEARLLKIERHENYDAR